MSGRAMGKKGSLAKLKASNVPRMYQPTASKGSQLQRARHQRERQLLIDTSRKQAMSAHATRKAQRKPNVSFPATSPSVLAIEKHRASTIRKARKGKTVIPREIQRLAYTGPKLSPVGEEEQEEEKGKNMMGGMPPEGMPGAVTRRTRPARRKQTRSRPHSQHRSSVLDNFAFGDLTEETEEEVAEAAKGATTRPPTLSDILKGNPIYPKLSAPRTRRRAKRKILGYEPDEQLGTLAEGGKRKRHRGYGGGQGRGRRRGHSRKTRKHL